VPFINDASEMMGSSTQMQPVGRWIAGDLPPQTGRQALQDALQQVGAPVILVDKDGRLAAGRNGLVEIGSPPRPTGSAGRTEFPLLAYVPALHPETLGHAHFKTLYGLRYPYVVGAMANGITSVQMVEAAGRAGMIGFFGAAGLSPPEIANAVDELQRRLGKIPFGFNLIHSPAEPDLEAATVNLYLNKGVDLVSASAYLDLTLPLVYYRVHGIHRDSAGRIVCPNQIIAKVSRIEVARKFFAPAPDKFLRQLVDQRRITADQAELARQVPLAETMTAEADSGGHTDNQPAISLLPTILALRNRMAEKFHYDRPLCVGLAGGIATPVSAAAAFALGADYVLTGSINQGCLEAGTSEAVRRMLAEASQADVTMAPAADMFEMGVKVQVLKRGTMFPFRAAKLYDLYCRYNSLADLPGSECEVLERDIFRCAFDQEWEQTRAYFSNRDLQQIARAEKDPKHKMALLFRSYLGRSSGWANCGEPSRRIDYQIWCGPAMGAFNEWVKGSFLAEPDNRTTVTVALNLLLGAAVVTRCNWLRAQGIALPASLGQFAPLPLSEIREILGE
jgi:PfaD family protein